MKRGSSTRLMGAPRTSAIASVISIPFRLRGGHGAGPDRLGGVADGGDDVLVARAAAVVALDRVTDLGVGRVGGAVPQVDRGHDHARRAEAALQAVLLPEGGLHRVEVLALGKA